MKKIAIIGAGISGLFIANLFRENPNYSVTIYEKNNSIKLDEGYGIQLSTNSIKLLNEIGFNSFDNDERFNPEKIDFYEIKKQKRICDLDISEFNSKNCKYTTLKRSKLVEFLKKRLDHSIIKYNHNIIKIVAITHSVKKYLINSFKIDKKKIHVIPSASSLNFKFKKLKKVKKYNIGFFGSLDKSKGSNFIISLSQKDKTNNYFIYGGKPYEVKKLNKNIPKNLKIYPSIAYGKIKSHLSKMDILLMPSNTKKLRSLGGIGNIAKFTSPLKLFDYLASGKLIITSNLKVFQEILTDKKNCIIINKLNVNNWKKRIKQVKNQLFKINNIKKNAYILSKNYTYQIRAKKY